jgi:hypothetical protein
MQLRLVVQVGSWLLRSVGDEAEVIGGDTIMTTATWLEMPVAQSLTTAAAARPRYAVEGNALLIYRGDKVYVAMKEATATEDLSQQPEVRRLSDGEAQELEASLPGIGAARLNGLGAGRTNPAAEYNLLLLGDLISWVTAKLGIRQCRACNRRRQRLNRIAIWRSRGG